MSIYRIYESPIRKKQVIKDGWSWFAFLLPFIWALVNRLWARFFLFFMLNVIVGVFINVTNGHPIAIAFGLSMGLALHLQFALEGYKWKGAELLKRGFENTIIVNAESREGALVALIKREASLHDRLNEVIPPLPEEKDGPDAVLTLIATPFIVLAFEAFGSMLK